MAQSQLKISTPSEHSFLDVLFPLALEVEEALETYLPKQTKLAQAMRYAVLGGGKRFRAYLAVTTAELYGVPRSQSVAAASAIELVHAYSLVHDDLPAMDDSDLRRGKPSCHVKFDEATAILVGDALMPLAFQIISHPNTHPDGNIRSLLVEKLAASIGPKGMALGQMMDLGLEGDTTSSANLIGLEQLKTGELIACSCEMGAILGGGSLQDRKYLRQYGLKLGLAFQIIDDILDARGSSEILGKPTGQDHKKVTFVSLMGLEGAMQKATVYIDEANQALDNLPFNTEALKDASQFALDRML